MSKLNRYQWIFRSISQEYELSFDSVGESLEHAFSNLPKDQQNIVKQKLVDMPANLKSIRVNGHKF